MGKILFTIFLFLPLIVVSAAQLPPNFDESMVATGINRPTTMAIAPDGRIFISEQDGLIRIVKYGVLLTTPFATIPVDSTNERGLMGITFDPDFVHNQYVYVFYTARTPAIHNRVSRFTANGDVAVPGSELVIIEFENLGGYVVHNGGALHFGPDGKLYISRGESNTPTNAQSMTSLRGKILRINSDGTIPADNPFYNTATGVYRSIFALGFRNPFSFDLQPGTGKLFANDVGSGIQAGQEEINEVQAGQNFGWPTCTGGPCNPPQSGMTSPIHYYKTSQANSTTVGCAIVAGTFYDPVVAQFPPAYLGKFLYSDYCNQWIRLIDPQTYATSPFATSLSGDFIVDIDLAPDGSLYYLARTSPNLGGLYKIEYSQTLPPTITLQPMDQTVGFGQPVTFLVSAMGTPPLQYQWAKDGVDIPGETASTLTIDSAQPSDSGVYNCVVTNSYGSADSNHVTLTVGSNTAPQGTIQAPVNGTFYNAADSILYSGSGIDAEDGALPPEAFTWQVDFHHDLHVHPFIPPTAGITGGTFTIPVTGETEPTVWYRIYLTVHDSFGASTTTYVEIFPNKSDVTLNTNPPNLQLKLDGAPVTAPSIFTGVVGVLRTIEAPTPQFSGGKNWRFQSWSDAGSGSHTISTPSSDTTYTATYAEDAVPTVSITAPATGSSFVAPTNVTITAAASDDVAVAKVDFFSGQSLLWSDNSPPYSYLWNNVPLGSYTVSAVATDSMGQTATSQSITFNVTGGGPGPLPSPWVSQDIGSPAPAGNSVYNSATFTYSVTAGGTDIWDKTDRFRYSYQPFNGNGQIIARVASLQPINPWSKAGIMIRTSTANNAANVFLGITPSNGAILTQRPTAGASCSIIKKTGIVAPQWVKLVRSGNTFTGYRSADGTNWILIGSFNVVVPNNVLAGLAVTSHQNGVLCTSTFTNVSVTSTIP